MLRPERHLRRIQERVDDDEEEDRFSYSSRPRLAKKAKKDVAGEGLLLKRPCLHWTLDSSESFSDWTIQILTPSSSSSSSSKSTLEEETDEEAGKASSTTTTEGTCYHVHKCILAVGERKCEYFVRLFQHGNNSGAAFLESQESKSRIVLHPLAAKAFPIFLDYMYVFSRTNNNNVDDLFNTDNTTALSHLAQYFENDSLREDSERAWREDLSVQTLGTYYEHAKIFHDDDIVRAVTDCITDWMYKSDPYLSVNNATSELIDKSDPQLWLNVLEQNKSPQTWYLSILIARFCWVHRDTLDKATFAELTKKEHLRDIHGKAALEFLAVDERLSKVDDRQEEGESSSPTRNKDPSSEEEMTELQDRCMQALCNDWPDFDLNEEVLAHVKPRLVVKLLQHSQNQARSPQPPPQQQQQPDPAVRGGQGDIVRPARPDEDEESDLEGRRDDHQFLDLNVLPEDLSDNQDDDSIFSRLHRAEEPPPLPPQQQQQQQQPRPDRQPWRRPLRLDRLDRQPPPPWHEPQRYPLRIDRRDRQPPPQQQQQRRQPPRLDRLDRQLPPPWHEPQRQRRIRPRRHQRSNSRFAPHFRDQF